MFGLGTFIHKRRWPLLVLTMIFAAVAGVYGVGVFDDMKPGGFEDPGSESRKAAELAERAFPNRAPDAILIYRSADRTVDDPEFRKAVTERVDSLSGDAVTGVAHHWQQRRPELVSTDRHATFVAVNLKGADDNDKSASWDRIKDNVAIDGYETLRGGGIPTGQDAGDRVATDLGLAEGLSFPILLLLLVIVFGGLVAASMPLLIGGLSILGSMAILRLIAQFTDISVFALSLVTILGLAVAIDYGLFIVSRYREEIDRGHDGAEAIGHTLAIAGRTVMVSGLTVAVALAGTMFFPFMFLESMAYGGMAAVLLAVLFSVIALPAALAVLGPRVNALSPRRRKRRAEADAGKRADSGAWFRLAQGVMKRPGIIALATLGVLLFLSVPFSRIEFGVNDARQLPATAEGRKVADQLERDFPDSNTKTIDAIITLSGQADSPERFPGIEQYARRLQDTPGARTAEITGAQGQTARVSVTYDGEAVSKASRDLVDRLREVTPPPDSRAYFTGETATFDDTLDKLGERLPWMLIYIAVATYLLLFMAFGSVLMPIKAILMNLLSLSATFGILVWVFQEGHLENVIRFESTGNIEPNMPIMLFALIFGLSMDYEVFLISRVREQFDILGDNAKAVATGLQSTGGLITSAALLMCVPLAAIATGQVLTMKVFGVGMVIAVILDATIVRVLLVPALMKLMGRATWWAPRPLARLYARYGIRETDSVAAPTPGTDPPGSDTPTDTRPATATP